MHFSIPNNMTQTRQHEEGWQRANNQICLQCWSFWTSHLQWDLSTNCSQIPKIEQATLLPWWSPIELEAPGHTDFGIQNKYQWKVWQRGHQAGGEIRWPLTNFSWLENHFYYILNKIINKIMTVYWQTHLIMFTIYNTATEIHFTNFKRLRIVFHND